MRTGLAVVLKRRCQCRQHGGPRSGGAL